MARVRVKGSDISVQVLKRNSKTAWVRLPQETYQSHIIKRHILKHNLREDQERRVIVPGLK